jgi:hypothetical protein
MINKSVLNLLFKKTCFMLRSRDFFDIVRQTEKKKSNDLSFCHC